jgi:hypothetical protein
VYIQSEKVLDMHFRICHTYAHSPQGIQGDRFFPFHNIAPGGNRLWTSAYGVLYVAHGHRQIHYWQL